MRGMVRDSRGGSKSDRKLVEAPNVALGRSREPTNGVILLVSPPGLLYCPL